MPRGYISYTVMVREILILGVLFLAPGCAKDADPLQECENNMKTLASAMAYYVSKNDGQFPEADKWCDTLKDKVGVEGRRFHCPGDQVGPCSYAMNEYAQKCLSGERSEMVLLFESIAGWNQHGGSKILRTNHHTDGVYVVFCDFRVRFVPVAETDKLVWKPIPK